MVQSALDDLIGLYLVSKKLPSDLLIESNAVQLVGYRLQNLLLSDWVIDWLTAGVLYRSDILSQ